MQAVKNKRRFMKAKQFDDGFDAGKDVTGALDLTEARRTKQTPSWTGWRRAKRKFAASKQCNLFHGRFAEIALRLVGAGAEHRSG